MRTLIVQLPGRAPDGSVPRLELAPGEQASFGRGAPDLPVDIVLPDPGVGRLAGHIRVVEDHWVLSNLSRDRTYVVENPEGGGEFIKVAPRRLDAPVPFEFARVVLPGARDAVSFTVFAPQHTYADETTVGQPTGTQTLAAFPLDETAKYFLVLVALCEPRLRDMSSAYLPTVPEIVERLRGLPSCRDVTRSAVNFHIEYLARTKLRVKSSTGEAGSGGKADWQRAALVALALRFNLVREEHLALLPSRRVGAHRLNEPAGT
jgi:hypothetical protein